MSVYYLLNSPGPWIVIYTVFHSLAPTQGLSAESSLEWTGWFPWFHSFLSSTCPAHRPNSHPKVKFELNHPQLKILPWLNFTRETTKALHTMQWALLGHLEKGQLRGTVKVGQVDLKKMERQPSLAGNFLSPSLPHSLSTRGQDLCWALKRKAIMLLCCPPYHTHIPPHKRYGACSLSTLPLSDQSGVLMNVWPPWEVGVRWGLISRVCQFQCKYSLYGWCQTTKVVTEGGVRCKCIEAHHWYFHHMDIIDTKTSRT